ncbi:MAG: diguanylate cyclase [Gammaproteobacteria bacterium]|nr:diguanylate cyclase [Gammaproteobacteria bacterium]
MNRLVLERRYWIIPLAIWMALAAGSLLWNWRHLTGHAHELALGHGRFVFAVMESMRLWNAHSGGVYAPVDAGAPGVRLPGLAEDIATPSGGRLTQISPGYMLRQLGATLGELTDVDARLTSLDPVNPKNAPDDWERAGLEAFADGAREHFALADEGGVPYMRYMAALVVTEPCLECHAHQDYREGDVRGALSVRFDAGELLAGADHQRMSLGVVHGVVWLLVSTLILASLGHMRRHAMSLQRARQEQEDLVAQRTAELQQEMSEREFTAARLRLLIESSGEGILGLDARGRCTFCNGLALEALGYAAQEDLLGRDLEPLLVAGDGHPFVAAYRMGHTVHRDDIDFRRADGRSFPVEFRARPMVVDGVTQGAVVSFSDITDRKAVAQKVWRQANYDTLTGLPNRTLFAERLRQAIAQVDRHGHAMALLYIDLDGFKNVNDAFGHAAGDRLLVETARRITGAVRESDTVARMGGDEFTVILTGLLHHIDAAVAAGKIVELLAQPFALGGAEGRVTASVGIAVYPSDAFSADELLKHADQAMYRAKAEGRNRYSFFAPAVQEAPA